MSEKTHQIERGCSGCSGRIPKICPVGIFCLEGFFPVELSKGFLEYSWKYWNHFIIIPESCNPQKSIELLPFRFLQIKKTSTSHQIYGIQHQTPQNYKIITSLGTYSSNWILFPGFFGGENKTTTWNNPYNPVHQNLIGSLGRQARGLKKPPPWALDQAPVAPTVDLDLLRVEMDGRMVLGCDGFVRMG